VLNRVRPAHMGFGEGSETGFLKNHNAQGTFVATIGVLDGFLAV